MSVKNVGLNKNQKEIFNEINKNNKITQEELAKLLNTSKRTIERNISSMQEKGIIKREGSKKTGYWKINMI